MAEARISTAESLQSIRESEGEASSPPLDMSTAGEGRLLTRAASLRDGDINAFEVSLSLFTLVNSILLTPFGQSKNLKIESHEISKIGRRLKG